MEEFNFTQQEYETIIEYNSYDEQYGYNIKVSK